MIMPGNQMDGCDFSHGVCLTRARLKRAVADATGHPTRWRAAIEALKEHQCEPRALEIHDILEVVDEYARLYHRAVTAADLIHDREECRREVVRLIQQYASEVTI